MPDRSSPDPAAAEILAAARAILPWMIEIRRDLHRHPELGLEEHRTRGGCRSCSTSSGIAHRAGLAGTGVLGPRGRRRPAVRGRAPVVALRADLDALPLQDAKDVPYRSQIAGQHARLRPRRAHRHPARRGAPAVANGVASSGHGQADLPAGRGNVGRRAAADRRTACSTIRRVDAIFGLHVDPGVRRRLGRPALRPAQRLLRRSWRSPCTDAPATAPIPPPASTRSSPRRRW